MFKSDEKRSGSPVPEVSSGAKELARDLPLNTDTESATVLDDTSEYMLNAKREGINPAFMAKVVVLNRAMAELGMGRYQWELFFTSGFGWMADNLCEFNRIIHFWVLLPPAQVPRHDDISAAVCLETWLTLNRASSYLYRHALRR